MKYLNDQEYYSIIKDIINHPEFLKRKEYKHHENISVFDHSLKVSYLSYRLAKFFHLDKEDVAIGALLHDFYYKPWQTNYKKEKLFKKHGFVHASQALDNSKKFFPEFINKKTSNIILRHMFPLNIMPPKYLESWVVTTIDKYVSLEVLKYPKSWLRYFGYKPKN